MSKWDCLIQHCLCCILYLLLCMDMRSDMFNNVFSVLLFFVDAFYFPESVEDRCVRAGNLIHFFLGQRKSSRKRAVFTKRIIWASTLRLFVRRHFHSSLTSVVYHQLLKGHLSFGSNGTCINDDIWHNMLNCFVCCCRMFGRKKKPLHTLSLRWQGACVLPPMWCLRCAVELSWVRKKV